MALHSKKTFVKSDKDKSDEEPKSSSFGGVLIGILGLAAAGAAGYYALQFYEAERNVRGTLDSTLIAKRLCEGDLSRERIRSGELVKLEANLNVSKSELEELRKQRAQTEARLAAFRALTEKFRKMIDTGQIKVLIRNGRMIMKLPEGILFGSGSAELSDKGKSTLQEVAATLKTLTERDFMIAGHTDNVQVSKNLPYHSNWELSTARAVTVTEYLIGSGMSPKQLVAAGYGEYDPISKTNKGENRRIEIVLLPNINELPHFPDDIQAKEKSGKR